MRITTKATTIACMVLAFTAAVVYLLVGTHVVVIPRLGADEAPVAIWYVAAGGYLTGGLLILWKKRWLWTVGLVANALVISIFFLAYHRESAMMLSSAGLTTKMAQVSLEAGLIYLLVAGRQGATRR